MPKIIENLESRLVEEARRQAWEGGYAAVTIRSVAAACGVGVGTVYNYFDSKDALLAAFLLADWKDCLQAIEEAKAARPEPEAVLQAMYRQLKYYSGAHRSIFGEQSAAKIFSGTMGQYHCILRDQLAQPLVSFCSSTFRAQFVAEALLSWTIEGQTAEQLLPLLLSLLQ